MHYLSYIFLTGGQMANKLERDFQPGVIARVREIVPGCVILKNDANYLTGVPDLLILRGPRWAMLETKRQPDSKRQANQPYYVAKFNEWSFAAFVNQQNYEDVLIQLDHFFNS